MIDLKKAITSLTTNEVDFVIIGGVAITLHASGYITRDLDFCYSREKANIARLVAALAPFYPKPRDWPEDLRYIFDETSIRNGTNFTFETSIGSIDLLGEVKGIGVYKDAFANSIEYEIYGQKVRAFTLDALITSKTAADRPKDHLVLPELWALREALDPNEK
jgi:predicted nucleotidyltransferase